MDIVTKNVLILTNNLTSGAIPHQIVDSSPYIDNCFNLYVGALLGGRDDRISENIVETLRKKDVGTIRYEFDTKPFYRAALELHKSLRGFDIVHTHLVRSGVLGRIIAYFSSVETIISTEHSVQHSRNKKQRVLNSITLPLADTVVSVSQQVDESFNKIENSLIPEEKRTVIYNTVDPQDVQKHLDAPVPEEFLEFIDTNQPIIGSVGRLIEAKNQTLLIESLYELKKNGYDIKLVLVGDGERRAELESKAREFGITDSLLITGWIERNAVFPLIKNFDIFAMPSKYEGHPVAVVEAMLAKKPIIASDIEVFHETLGETGEYSSGDAKSWAEKIKYYLSNQQIAERNGQFAKERAIDLFHPENVAKDYMGVYRDKL